MAKIGDKVSVEHKDKRYDGILMPSEEDSKDILILKLVNGYNIGFDKKETKVKVLESAREYKFPSAKLTKDKKLPKIVIITTGGTITSKVDYKTGAVHPLIRPEELLAQVPELSKIANIEIKNPFAVLSEDMTSKNWRDLAKEVMKALNSDAIGVIVTHGTDTLAYTASALSFMIKDLNKPVALVGGQRSSDRGSFDGALNLICAAYYCCSDIAEVSVVMHGTSSDDYCLAIPGTKARKMHTSRRDAFRPVNSLPFAKIYNKGMIELIRKDFNKRSTGKVKLDNKFEKKVALVKFAPGQGPGVVDYYAKQGYKGIILEGTGLGHVAITGLNSWIKSIQQAVKKGIFVGITSQCLYGRTDLFVYSNGRKLLDAGCIQLGDMLPETAYIKLGWALAHVKNSEDVKKLMLENISKEISEKEDPKSYLY